MEKSRFPTQRERVRLLGAWAPTRRGARRRLSPELVTHVEGFLALPGRDAPDDVLRECLEPATNPPGAALFAALAHGAPVEVTYQQCYNSAMQMALGDGQGLGFSESMNLERCRVSCHAFRALVAAAHGVTDPYPGVSPLMRNSVPRGKGAWSKARAVCAYAMHDVDCDPLESRDQWDERMLRALGCDSAGDRQ